MTEWFSEELTGQWRQSLPILEKLVDQQSPFQHIQLFQTKDFGRMLVLDGKVQCTERDEYTYHEMLAHVPLLTHADPRKVMVVGGGDGGTAREALKHPQVEKVTLVEIDAQVIEVCREWLPSLAVGLQPGPRLEIVTEDAAKVISSAEKQDCILVDSSDPEGPSEILFGDAFFASLKAALKPGGVIAVQAGSPVFFSRQVAEAKAKLEKVFRYVRPYLVPVLTYPGGLWCLIAASDSRDPALPPRPHPTTARYYCPEIHLASMARFQV